MRQKNKILLTAASLLLMAGCSKPEETVGTVPSSVLLKAPEVDTENSVIRLRAVYNGDDKAVKDAEFTMTDIQGGVKHSYIRLPVERRRSRRYSHRTRLRQGLHFQF